MKVLGGYLRLSLRGTAPFTRPIQILSKRCLMLTSHCLSDKDGIKNTEGSFNESLLKYLACPLSKKPLRYEKETNELICDDIGVAYPIINGIPNLVPQDGRMLKTNQKVNIENGPQTKQ